MQAPDFRAVFDASPNPYMLLDRELRFVDANVAYLRVTGKAREDLIGNHVLDVFPNDPADPDNHNARLLRDSLLRVLATRAVDTLAFIPYRVPIEREGRVIEDERYWSATHTPILDERGDVCLILQHTVDVTDLHAKRDASCAAVQMEAGVLQRARRVQETNDTLRFLIEAIPQQVWTANPEGDLVTVNRRVLEYFAANSENILGSGWLDFLHPDDVEMCRRKWLASLATGHEYEVEFRLRRGDGVFRWHLGRATALCGSDDAVTMWFGTNTDIDDRKLVEHALQERATFEQQLIGIVSHDLRNPINAIGIAAALLLQRGNLDDLQGKAVSRIVSSSERARRLIRDFLDFTQARSTGRIPISPAAANIREIARQVFDEVLLAHADRPATIEHEGEETGHWDADRLAQVIANLLGNAFQHGTPGGTVRLRTRGTGDEVLIEVHNEGLPIPAGDIARLFRPFERGSGTLPSSARSVGLGLYISEQIVSAHRGTIAVRSTVDGTLFTVRLPRSVDRSSRVA